MLKNVSTPEKDKGIESRKKIATSFMNSEVNMLKLNAKFKKETPEPEKITMQEWALACEHLLPEIDSYKDQQHPANNSSDEYKPFIDSNLAKIKQFLRRNINLDYGKEVQALFEPDTEYCVAIVPLETSGYDFSESDVADGQYVKIMKIGLDDMVKGTYCFKNGRMYSTTKFGKFLKWFPSEINQVCKFRTPAASEYPKDVQEVPAFAERIFDLYRKALSNNISLINNAIIAINNPNVIDIRGGNSQEIVDNVVYTQKKANGVVNKG